MTDNPTTPSPPVRWGVREEGNMTDDPQTTLLIDRSTGEIAGVPETLARKADRRAFEVFNAEARYGCSFQQCLGQVYLVGLKVGLEISK